MRPTGMPVQSRRPRDRLTIDDGHESAARLALHAARGEPAARAARRDRPRARHREAARGAREVLHHLPALDAPAASSFLEALRFLQRSRCASVTRRRVDTGRTLARPSRSSVFSARCACGRRPRSGGVACWLTATRAHAVSSSSRTCRATAAPGGTGRKAARPPHGLVENLHAVMRFQRKRDAAHHRDRARLVGLATCTTWKRRVSAGPFRCAADTRTMSSPRSCARCRARAPASAGWRRRPCRPRRPRRSTCGLRR
jgi:hypothetical protein